MFTPAELLRRQPLPERTDRQSAELLEVMLRALEKIIREDLASRRTARSRVRRMDLTDALGGLEPVRAALRETPAGANLALLVLGVFQHWIRSDANYARQRYQGSVKGRQVANTATRRPHNTKQRHATLRARAAKLSADLTASDKARILARTSRLSERQIRRIISK